MKRQVLFVQGGGDGAYEADGKLVASLRRALGPDFEVVYPRMPNEGTPDYATWKLRISQELDDLEGEIVLVGHSLGGYMLAKYVSEEIRREQPIIGICLVATPYPGGDDNWVYQGFALPEDLAAKFPKGAAIFLYHSQDDQTVPFAHVGLYGKEFPGATIRETAGGHQLGDDLTGLAQDIKRL
ncbi:MAG: alpha/beta fold hydrolase [Nitrolancea sp.]